MRPKLLYPVRGCIVSSSLPAHEAYVLDHNLLPDRLRQATVQHELGRRQIARQRETIEQLTAQGLDASAAVKLLDTLLESHVLQIAHRDRIERQAWNATSGDRKPW